MTDSEFTINTDEITPRNRNTRRSRPLPPGQTRHSYGNEDNDVAHATDDSFTDIDNDEPIARPAAPRQQKPRQRRPEMTDRTLRNTQNETSAVTPDEPTVQSRPKRRRSDRQDETPRLVSFLMDRRISIWLGIVFILVGAGLFAVLLGYLRTGAFDQAVILNMSPDEVVATGTTVESLMGPLGAWLGHVLFAEAFGIGAFVVVLYFVTLGWKLLTAKSFSFWGLTFRCALLAVSISIVLGFVTYAVGSTIFWGGVHGHYVNKWLFEMTGVPGAIFVSLLLVGTLVAVYINELTRAYKYWKGNAEQRRLRKEQRIERKMLRDDENGVSTEKVGGTDSNPAVSKETETRNVAPTSAGMPDESLAEETVPEDFNTVVKSEKKTADKPETGAESEIAFTIDSRPSDANIASSTTSKDVEKKADAEKPRSEEEQAQNDEPGFEIDIPVAEKGKKSGTVAERLVAEQGEFDPRAELSRFKFPTLEMLVDHPVKTTVDIEEQQANKDRIIKTLANFGISINSIKATVGPTVTLYEIVPSEGIRTAQIKRLEDDIALSLAAKGIRIIAPMPGKGTVGIEVPNSDPQIVSMRSILSSKKFTESNAKLPVALGASISNEIFVADLASMPHALVAGATGQGKSVGLNVLISSLLFRKHPTELKFVLIDPKMVEFSIYEQLRGHYLAALPGEEEAIVTDSSKVLNVLNSLCIEMDNRYALLRKAAVNKIEDYNRKFCQRRLSIEKGHKYLPYIVVIIDEFADLIMTGGKEIEMPVMRITQKARAVGIHMIIATQRPETKVLTGLIKANCPSRIAFRVLQNVDSRTILDRPGAERLIGRGDMLYSQGGDLERVQCAFISTDEIDSICKFIDSQTGFEEPYPLPEPMADNGPAFGGAGGSIGGGMDRDPLFDEAARFITLSSTASTSSLQRRFEIGYNRAGKIMDQMEAAGIVGPASGSKPRSVLIDPEALERILANR